MIVDLRFHLYRVSRTLVTRFLSNPVIIRVPFSEYSVFPKTNKGKRVLRNLDLV